MYSLDFCFFSSWKRKSHTAAVSPACGRQAWQGCLFADSSAVEEEILIWPKGVIKYAAASGFEGEVIQISIRKRDKRQVAYQKIAQEVDSSTANLTISLQEKQHLQTAVVQKKKVKFVGVLIGAVILLVLVVYLIFRYRLFWQH